MKLFSFLKKQEQGKVLIVVLDSASVTAGLVKFSPNQKPQFLAMSRAEIVLQEDLNFRRFMAGTISALSDALTQIQKNAAGRPDHIHFCLASPWYVSQTRVVHYSQAKPFIVSGSLIDSLAEAEVADFEAERIKAKTIILGPSNRVIDIKTMQMKLNGYQTAKPIGKFAQDLSVSFYISLTSEKIIRSLSDAALKVFHHRDLYFHTLPFAAYSGLVILAPQSEDFLLCLVGGEISDVLIVHRGIIVETASFPLGKNFVLRTVAKRFSTLSAEASSLLRAYSDQSLSSSVTPLFQETLGYVKTEWLKSFKNLLELSSLEYLLPGLCYLIAAPDFEDIFAGFVADPSLKTLTSSNRPFSVAPLNAAFFRNFLDSLPGITLEGFLGIAAIFLERVYKL